MIIVDTVADLDLQARLSDAIQAKEDYHNQYGTTKQDLDKLDGMVHNLSPIRKGCKEANDSIDG